VGETAVVKAVVGDDAVGGAAAAAAASYQICMVAATCLSMRKHTLPSPRQHP
jgi:hypothetical protein